MKFTPPKGNPAAVGKVDRPASKTALFPASAERKAEKLAVALVREWLSAVGGVYTEDRFRRWQLEESIRRDAAPLPGSWEAEAAAAADELEAMINPAFLAVAPDALTYTPAEVKKAIRLAGRNTADLITNISTKLKGDVRKSVFDGIHNGESYRSVYKKITTDAPLPDLTSAPGWDAKKRAVLVARAQIQKRHLR